MCRHPLTLITSAPTVGATTGMEARTRNIRARCLRRCCGSRSAITDLAIAMPTPAPRPWMRRSPISSGTDCTSEQQNVATVHSAEPSSSGGRLAMSAINPLINCPTASPAMQLVTVSWASTDDAPRSRWSCGRPGR